MQDGHKTSGDANTEEIHEENNVQDTTACIPFPEEASNGLWLCQQLNGKKRKGQYVFQPGHALDTSHGNCFFHVWMFMLHQTPKAEYLFL